MSPHLLGEGAPFSRLSSCSYWLPILLPSQLGCGPCSPHCLLHGGVFLPGIRGAAGGQAVPVAGEGPPGRLDPVWVGRASLCQAHTNLWLCSSWGQEANRPARRGERPWIITMGHRPMYCSNNDKDDCTQYESIVSRPGRSRPEPLAFLRKQGVARTFVCFTKQIYLAAQLHT